MAICSTVDNHGMQGKTYHYIPSAGCRRISGCMPGLPPLPLSALTLGPIELFLLHILTPLSQLLMVSIFLFLKYNRGAPAVSHGLSFT